MVQEKTYLELSSADEGAHKFYEVAIGRNHIACALLVWSRLNTNRLIP